MVRPVLRNGAPSARGRATIDVLGLDRDMLSECRRKCLRLVDAAVRHWVERVEELDDPDRVRRERLDREDLMA
ncbi:hypothetical protein JCM9957A_64760 [Kineosporia succinea]